MIYKMKSAIEISINNTSGVLILSSKRSQKRLFDIHESIDKNEDEKLIGSWLIVNLLNIQQVIFQSLNFGNRSELKVVCFNDRFT